MEPIPHVFEAITYTPKKAGGEVPRASLISAPGFVQQHPECVGIPIEGVMLEEEGTAVTIIEWKSYEGHVETFRKSDLCKKMGQARQRLDDGQSIEAHYRFFSPLPVNPVPAYLERLTMSLKPDVDFEAFYKEWTTALTGVQRAKGCGVIAIGRQIEDPTKVLQIQGWATLEDHKVAFPAQPDFNDIMADLTKVVQKYCDGGWSGCKGGHIKTSPTA